MTIKELKKVYYSERGSIAWVKLLDKDTKEIVNGATIEYCVANYGESYIQWIIPEADQIVIKLK